MAAIYRGTAAIAERMCRHFLAKKTEQNQTLETSAVVPSGVYPIEGLTMAFNIDVAFKPNQRGDVYMAKTLSLLEQNPSHEQIARRAYEIFEESGRVQGQDVQNWLEAERQLKTAAKMPQVAQRGASGAVVHLPARLTVRSREPITRA